jgi:hypothetical protein
VPPPGPVTFQTHEEATALRGRRKKIARKLTAKELETRNFNQGSFSYQPAKEPASIFLLGFRVALS